MNYPKIVSYRLAFQTKDFTHYLHMNTQIKTIQIVYIIYGNVIIWPGTLISKTNNGHSGMLVHERAPLDS